MAGLIAATDKERLASLKEFAVKQKLAPTQMEYATFFSDYKYHEPTKLMYWHVNDRVYEVRFDTRNDVASLVPGAKLYTGGTIRTGSITATEIKPEHIIKATAPHKIYTEKEVKELQEHHDEILAQQKDKYEKELDTARAEIETLTKEVLSLERTLDEYEEDRTWLKIKKA